MNRIFYLQKKVTMVNRIVFTLISIFLLIQDKVEGQTSYDQEIKTVADSLIKTLSPLQKRSALIAFNDTARIKWNNLPVGMRARAGISIGDMTEQQRRLLHRILSASLSSQGYLKATGIMHLDNLLNMWVDTAYSLQEFNDTVKQFLTDLKWSHRNYYLAFFVFPSDATG